ncbi:MAG TPA: hypothetical protein VEV41_15095 [Terriglobales bacterium]|jgi:hypothetical protein|nr:hypothetical protein [Terriglobales bacterium]
MKNPHEILTLKEMEILRLRRETAALRLVIELLNEDNELAEAPSDTLGRPAPICLGATGDD